MLRSPFQGDNSKLGDNLRQMLSAKCYYYLLLLKSQLGNIPSTLLSTSLFTNDIFLISLASGCLLFDAISTRFDFGNDDIY